MNPLLLTVSEAAELLGVSRWTVQGYIRRGLRFIPSGRIHKRIARAEIDRWISANQVSSDSAAFRKTLDGRTR